MIHPRVRSRRLASLTIALLAVASPLTRPLVSFAQPADAPDEVLTGRPDTPVTEANLDPAFMSTAAGITVRPPAGGKMIRRGGVSDEVVRFVSDESKWTFIVTRVILSEPVPLSIGVRDGTAAAGAEGKKVGFAETMAGQMPSDTPGKLLRTELMPINGYDGAILASRYTEQNAKRLIQQAIIRKTDKLYYVLTYSTPVSNDVADVTQDPAAARALDTFAKILDSAQLLDQEAITRDQTERLIRTRALMVNWTPPKLQEVLVHEQWLRLQKDGKDIGYTYIVEEPANDLPRASKKNLDTTSKPTGVRIGIRSRTYPQSGTVVDAESWFWVRYDRKQELFRNAVVSREGEKKPNFAIEHGTSVNRDRIVPVVVEDPASAKSEIQKTRDERTELQIWSTANITALPAITKQVPPYYLSQGLVHLLPRLMPLRQPRTYMFASYVSDTREVMTRYVDVLPATVVTLDGKQFTAIPVQEKAGLEGSVTTHYLSPEGKYLGSVNADSHITILVSDEATLRSIWKDAKLERPGDIEEEKK